MPVGLLNPTAVCGATRLNHGQIISGRKLPQSPHVRVQTRREEQGQQLGGALPYSQNLCCVDALWATWCPSEDHLVVRWRPPGGPLKTTWWPSEDHLVAL